MWIAGAFEDRSGKISHKRVGFYFALFMLYQFGKAAIATGNPVDVNILMVVGGLALGLAGLSVSEWFSMVKKKDETQSA